MRYEMPSCLPSSISVEPRSLRRRARRSSKLSQVSRFLAEVRSSGFKALDAAAFRRPCAALASSGVMWGGGQRE